MQNIVFKALAHPVRREILTKLRQGPSMAGDLAADFDASWPTISRHLSVLKNASLISAERQGTQIQYRINTSVLEDTAITLMAIIGRDVAPSSSPLKKEYSHD